MLPSVSLILLRGTKPDEQQIKSYTDKYKLTTNAYLLEQISSLRLTWQQHLFSAVHVSLKDSSSLEKPF